MKRVFAWVCIVVLSVGAVFLGGCAPKQPVPEGGGYALKIGYTLYPPMDYMEDGQLVGFDADFARAVCEELGYVAQFVEIEWNTKATSLLSGEIDVIWNGMTITEELQRQFLITDAYMGNQQVLVVKKENASKFADADDLAKGVFHSCGKGIGGGLGGIGQSVACRCYDKQGYHTARRIFGGACRHVGSSGSRRHHGQDHDCGRYRLQHAYIRGCRI